MLKKIIITISIFLALIIISVVLYKFAGGSFDKFSSISKEFSLWQAIKDMFMTIYKGLLNRFN